MSLGQIASSILFFSFIQLNSVGGKCPSWRSERENWPIRSESKFDHSEMSSVGDEENAFISEMGSTGKRRSTDENLLEQRLNCR